MTTQNPQESSNTVKPGIYKGRAVKGAEQTGLTDKGKPELNIKLFVPSLNRQLTTVLYLSPEAYQYSVERLRSLGCKGDIMGGDLSDIDANEVDIEVTYEMFESKMRMRVQIMGGGTFNVKNPVEKGDFWARVRALNGDGSAAAPGPKAEDPDF